MHILAVNAATQFRCVVAGDSDLTSGITVADGDLLELQIPNLIFLEYSVLKSLITPIQISDIRS